jgi:hypothetical protein
VVFLFAGVVGVTGEKICLPAFREVGVIGAAFSDRALAGELGAEVARLALLGDLGAEATLEVMVV